MPRYIDADKLTEAFVKAAKQVGNIGDQIAFRMMINEIPAADVRQNVRGEWIRRDSRYVGWISFDCSVCGETLELDRETSNDFKYCPFCGADMRPISALSENVKIVSNLKRGES